jgi:hypothetical protein
VKEKKYASIKRIDKDRRDFKIVWVGVRRRILFSRFG